MTSIQDAFDKVGVTPEGIYCLDCSQPFTTSTWSRHFLKAHPECIITKQYQFPRKIEAKIVLARAEEDRSKSAKVPLSIATKHFCLGCAKAFSDRANYFRHFKGKTTSCVSTPNQEHHALRCYELVDGRFYPVEPPTYISSTADVNRARMIATGPIPRTANILPIQPYVPPLETLKLFAAIGYLPNNNMIDPKKTELVLEKFVKSGDPINGWVKIFHKRVSGEPEFERVIRSDLEAMEYKILYEENTGFRKMMDAFDRLEYDGMSIINGIPGNWSAQTTRFSDQDGESDNAWLFRHRRESGTQRIEFGRMVAYLRRNSSCKIVHHYLRLMAREDLTLEEACSTGLVARMIYELAVLKEESGDSVSWILKYLQARCFTIESGELRFMDPGRVSSQMSTLTYIIRLSLTTILSMMQHSGDLSQEFVDSTINRVQKGPVINTISKWVAICRHHKKQMAPKITSTINLDGTIVCNNAVYPKSIWSRLIPIVNSKVMKIIETMFVGINCKKFIHAFHNHPELIKVNIVFATANNEMILLILSY